MSDSGNALPELRASDAERERAAEVLRVAASEGRLSVDELEDRLGAVYGVLTRNELDRLVGDVSPEQFGHASALGPAVPREGFAVKQGPGGQRWVISVMSGHERSGRWRIGPRCTVLNLMGGSEIDLNDVELAGPVTELRVYSIMGGAEVRVPNGVEVQVTNVAVMGGNDVKLGDEVPRAGGPVIRIRLVSIMGGTGVRRGRKAPNRSRRRQKGVTEAERPGELDRAPGELDR
jgi:hypothetical protein